MRAAIPRVIRAEQDLSEVVEFYSGVDEFVFDTETVGKKRLHHKVNRVTWLGLCHGTRVDVIPIGHPKGELVRDTYSERVPWWDDNDPTKTGKPRKKWKTIRHPAVFTDPPEQLWAEDVWPALEPVFFSDARKIGHNLKFDLLTVAKYFDGEPPPPPYGDSQLLARLLDTTRKAGLKDITKQLWEHDYDEENIAKPDKWGENGIEAAPFSKAALYTGLDVRYTWLIWQRFRRLLEKRGDTNLIRLEMDVLESLLPGALLGMPVDEAAMRELGHRLTRDHQEIEQKIFAASGEVWDLNSTPQKQRFVYEIRAHEPEVYTDKSCQDHTEGDHHDGCTPSTSAGVLESYAQRDDAVAALLEYANVQKLRSTYSGAINPDGSYVLNKQGLPIAGMLDFIVDGRVHPNLNQYGADTNRLSSSSPNLQNIPARSDDERAQALRKMFIADPGHLLVVADYAQIEYRVLAYLSEDPTLIEAFLQGWDPHAATMALLLDKDISEVTKQERDAGKGTNFGQVYGAGPATIAKSAGVSITRAKWIKKEYEVRFPKVTAWKKDVVNEARNQRPQPYVKTLLGHRRWLPGLWSSDDKRRFSAERQAVNTAVQGSAADIIKVAMVKLHRALPEGSTMLLQVHDELIVQAPEEQAEEVRTLVQETMESVSLLGRVPLEAEAHIGESWSEAK